ncbi:hypothetical protein [Campylobacter sp. CCUG 57310]|uniref:hypothetical protein n=1 Tax=Campylobacter sp. CCUG 57310 TaxID=2517362 RepID=UPI0015656AF8|nr:hypothetical protein [Campylobacter sp. CCUG 57310]
MKLIFYRYFMYLFLGLEVLLLPSFLDKELYSNFEYYKFIIFSAPFLMFGVPSGFLYCNYNLKNDYFNELIFFGIIHAFLIVVPVAWMYFDNLLFVILCFLMVLSMFVEHKLQTQRMFILAFALKPLISIFLILPFVIFYFKINIEITIDILFILMLFAFFVWLFVVYKKLELYKNYNIDIKKYFTMFKKGFPVNAGTALIALFFFCDRFVAKEYYSFELASYSLAYNLIQFIILALSTLAYVNVADIGENSDSIKLEFFKNKILYNYKIFLILLFLFVLFILTVSTFYSFNNLICYSIIMAIFLGNYFTINTMSSVALYLDFFKQMVFLLLFLFVINIVLTYTFIVFNVEYIFFLIKTGTILNLSAFYFIAITISRLKNENK